MCNNKPVYSDVTMARQRHIEMFVAANISVRRWRQAYWRRIRSEGNHSMPKRQYFRNLMLRANVKKSEVINKRRKPTFV